MSRPSAAERFEARIRNGRAHAAATASAVPVASRARVRLTEAVVANLDKQLAARGRDLSQRIEVWDDVLPGLVLRRAPSGAKSWSLRTNIAGRRSRVTLGSYPAVGVLAAREAARVHMGSIVTGADPVRAKREARSRARAEQAERLGEFVDGRYAEWAEVHLRSHQDTLDALKRDFGPGTDRKAGAGWWNRSMSRITRADVEAWRLTQAKRGNKPATINRAWQRLRAVLGKAEEWGVLQSAPPRVKRLKLTEGETRVRFLRPDERARLMAALDAREQRRREERARMIEWQRARSLPELPEHGRYTDHLLPLVLLALNTGLRRGELLKLQWSAIDFALGLLHVTAASAKSGKSRDIPLNKAAREVLTALRDQQQPNPADYVFGRHDGASMARVDTSWRGVLKAASLTDFRFHDLRHSFASELVQRAVPLYTVSGLLGHGDLSMTQRYSHLAPGVLADAVAKLDGIA